MSVPVRLANGTVTELPEAEAEVEFRAGRVALPRGYQVPMVSDTGEVLNVPAEDVAGYTAGRFASPEELQAQVQRNQDTSLTGVARTFGESTLSGLTMGGSDWVARGLGADTAAMARRREANPIANVAGQITGAALPMLIPGVGEANAARLAAEGVTAARELSTLGRVGEAAGSALRSVGLPSRAVAGAGDLAASGARLAGESILGTGRLSRLAAAGLEGSARGVTEGALMGVGQTISEAALSRNPDLTAEHLLANIGTGALFGGLAGGALGVGGRALREGVEVAASGAVRAAETAGMSRAALADARVVARLNASGLDEAAITALGTKPTQIVADLERLGIGTREGLSGASGLATARSSARDAATVIREADTTLTRLQGELGALPEVAVAQREKLGQQILQAATDKQIAEVVAASVARAPAREGLGAAIKEGVDSALNLGFLGHMVGSPISAATTFAAGVGKKLVENTAEAFVPALKSKAIDFLLRATEEGTANTARAAAGIIAKTATRAVQSAVPRAAAQASYTKAVEAAHAETPELVVRRVAAAMPELAHSAPQVLAAVTQRALTSRAYLESKIPITDRHPVGDLQPQLRKKSPVSESEQRRFLAVVEAVNNPKSIIDAVANQTLTTEQADVLKEVYPQLRLEIIGKVMEGLATATEPMSFQSKMRLGILLGAPTDPSLDPSMINMLQSSFGAPANAFAGAEAEKAKERTINQAAASSARRNVNLNSTGTDSREARSLRQ